MNARKVHYGGAGRNLFLFSSLDVYFQISPKISQMSLRDVVDPTLLLLIFVENLRSSNFVLESIPFLGTSCFILYQLTNYIKNPREDQANAIYLESKPFKPFHNTIKTSFEALGAKRTRGTETASLN
jgi:hypothetical protein